MLFMYKRESSFIRIRNGKGYVAKWITFGPRTKKMKKIEQNDSSTG